MSVTWAVAQAIRRLLDAPKQHPYHAHNWFRLVVAGGVKQRQCLTCLLTQKRCAKRWRTIDKGKVDVA